MGSIKEAKEQWLETRGIGTDTKPSEGKCYACSRVNTKKLKGTVFNLVADFLEQRKEGKMAKVVLITADGCTPCEEAREAIKDKLEAGIVEEINFDTCQDCDREAILSSGINAFPYMAIRTEEGAFIEPMKLATNQEMVPAEEPAGEPSEEQYEEQPYEEEG